MCRLHAHDQVSICSIFCGFLASVKLRKYTWETMIWALQRGATVETMGRGTVPGSPHRVKLISIESVMPSNHLILCRLLLLLPSILPSIRVFSSESVLCIRWPKYWSFSCSISPSNEYSGLISFRIDWFDFSHIILFLYIRLMSRILVFPSLT